jgi:hypothetical protein
MAAIIYCEWEIYCEWDEELSIEVLVTRPLTEAVERPGRAWVTELGPEVVCWWCVVWMQHMCG